MRMHAYYEATVNELTVFNELVAENLPFKTKGRTPGLKHSETQTIYTSSHFNIIDFQCEYEQPFTSKPDPGSRFCIHFIRKGYIRFNSSYNSTDAHSSRIFIKKPGCVNNLTHKGYGSDAFTIFNFSEEFYQNLKKKYYGEYSFLNNRSLCSSLLISSPESEYLHFAILQILQKNNVCSNEIDMLVSELLDTLFRKVSGRTDYKNAGENAKKNHLTTIEKAKEYIALNFTVNISLDGLSKHCNLSLFHFSRIFKQITCYSPHHYIQDFRLKHAEILIKTTSSPITDICYRSGFSRVDYFSTAFSNKFRASPQNLRNKFFKIKQDF